MFRPTVSKLAAPRAVLPNASRAAARRQAQPIAFRRYATEPQHAPAPANLHTHTGIILGALAAIGVGGYFLLKPVADVAHKTNTALEGMKNMKDSAAGATSEASGLVSGVAQATLGPTGFALYSALSSQAGGLNGFLSNLKDKDLQGVLDEVKKVGNDDVKRIVEKVERKVKEAGGKPEKVDWKGLAQELKTELPKSGQQMVDTLIGKIPDQKDIDQLIAKYKEIGSEQLKQVEASASKILQQVEKAKKDGKGQADAFLKGLKEASPNDVDDLIKQLKEAAKKAGLPADQAEAWLRSKAEDGKVDVDAMANQLQDKLKMAARFMPSDPKDLVKQVEQVSPSVAKLLQQAMEQSGVIKP